MMSVKQGGDAAKLNGLSANGSESGFVPFLRMQVPTWSVLLFLVIATLIGLSEFLALNRIFQVDEVQNVFMARLLATHIAHEYATEPSLLLLGPLTLVAGSSCLSG